MIRHYFFDADGTVVLDDDDIDRLHARSVGLDIPQDTYGSYDTDTHEIVDGRVVEKMKVLAWLLPKPAVRTRWTVGNGDYIYQGDRRVASCESSDFGPDDDEAHAALIVRCVNDTADRDAKIREYLLESIKRSNHNEDHVRVMAPVIRALSLLEPE